MGCFVVFDLDDTLYLERDFAYSGFRAVGRWASRRLGIAGLGKTCKRVFDQGERGHVFNRALAAHGIGAHPATVAKLVEVYRGHAPRIALAPDADRALDRFAGRSGLISDGPGDTQRAKVRALGLEDRIDHILLTDDFGPGAGKPSPVAFKEMELIAGATGGRLVYVADNPRKDFITPRLRGWRTVMIARPERVHRAPAPSVAHSAECSLTTLDDLDDCLTGALLRLTV